MTDLAGKLQIKSGARGRVINKPRAVSLGIRSTATGKDFVIAFVASVAELETLTPQALDGLKEDGLLWFCYPKKSSGVVTDINRDCGWKPLTERGYRGVRQISIDETWSALRFRVAVYIQARKTS